MAVSGNKSDEKVIGREQYTGLLDMGIEKINPSLEELKEMGYNPTKEPVYTTDEKDSDDSTETHKRTRVEFHLRKDIEGKPFRTKVAFFITNRERVSQNGKPQFINKFGNTAWPRDGEEKPDYNWYSNEGLRPCKEGEEQLTNFLQNFINAKPNVDECQIDSIEKIANGDVSELKTIQKLYKDNKVKVLLGVTDEGYQVVYDKFFGRPYQTNMKPWLKALEGQYGEFKVKGNLVDFQDNLTFQPYTGGSGVVKSDRPDDTSLFGGNPPSEDGGLSF